MVGAVNPVRIGWLARQIPTAFADPMARPVKFGRAHRGCLWFIRSFRRMAFNWFTAWFDLSVIENSETYSSIVQTHDIVHCFDTKVDYVHLHMFSCKHSARLFTYIQMCTHIDLCMYSKLQCIGQSCANIEFASIWVLDFSLLIALAECLKIC